MYSNMEETNQKELIDEAVHIKVTFAPLPTFGNHHKIYNKYKLYLKTNKFWKFGLLTITIDRDIGR